MRKMFLTVVAMLMLVITVIGCSSQSDKNPLSQNEETDIADQEEIETPADYIVADDFKMSEGVTPHAAVCQIDEWIYFSYYQAVYRIKVDGNHLEHLYDADLGEYRGLGTHGLFQCGDYLVFTQGSYIYRMNLATLETDVLFSAKKKQTCFKIAVENNNVYFIGTEGSYTHGIYRINIDDEKPEKILGLEKNAVLIHIQIVDGMIFYSDPFKGLYSIDLAGKNKKRILKAKHIGWDSFVVAEDYIFFINADYTLKKSNRKGKNIVTLEKSCWGIALLKDHILYSKLKVDDGFYHGEGIYKMPLEQSNGEKILDGLVDAFLGSSGNWIYYYVIKKVGTADMRRVRIDGSGDMSMPK